MVRTVLCCILGWTLLSCVNQNDKEKEQNSYAEIRYSIISIDTVSIEIDSLTSNFAPTYQYTHINQYKFFSIYNTGEHKIQIYDVGSLKNFKNINLRKEGPGTIPELLGFYIHSFDSVFLFSYDNNKVFLVDTAGTVINEYDVNEALANGDGYYEIALGDYFEPSYDSKNFILTFWLQPFINRRTFEYYQYPLAVDFDVKKENIRLHYGYYPDTYRKSDFHFLREDLHRTISNDFDIHHFSNAHHLFCYDKKNKELTISAFIKSEYLPGYIEPIVKKGDEDPTLQEQANYNITQGRYRRLHYDIKNKLYYRMVRHPQALKDVDGLLNGKLDSRLSVIVINSEFKIAGEVLLPEKSFIDFVSFVSDGVLWINMNHPKNPLNSENHFQFILYKAVQQ